EERLRSHGLEHDMNWTPAAITAFARDQITIVVDNIVTNAIEAMPNGGKLRVSFRQEDDVARLTITDSGPGIPLGEMDHLFEPFFTTKGDTPDGDTRHTGMGLAVAHGLVHEMHGSITAMNAPGGGLRVEIIWPVGGAGRSCS
ncbi:MAG: ATP-binding protein, partial [Phycisphaerales bacterium]|nr:ATP-binding protein [Phycisphaerales bacterium]